MVVTSTWTGGHESPIRFLAVFVVVWAACFCGGRAIAVYTVLAAATFLVPLVFDGADHTHHLGPYISEQMVVVPALAAVALTVALLQRSQLREHARAARVADQQDALRRVATAVADGRAGPELHALVAAEAARVLGAHAGAVLRFDGDHADVLGAWSTGSALFDIGRRRSRSCPACRSRGVRDGANAVHTGHEDVPMPPRVTALGYGEVAVGAIHLDGRVWGGISVATRCARRAARGCRRPAP